MPNLLNFNVIEKIKKATSKRSPEFLEVMVDNFLEHSYELIIKINLSFENKDFDQINKDIHQLKGTAAGFGAEQLSQLCVEIETTESSQSESLIKQLADCYKETKPQVKLAFTTKKSQ
ncbi:Hpt domain-containing protein [Candidatus Halobeggiatoa sp. HSG11]|nr:Hpt domain-containing protein [Candidatus Halobeggiatoa sp. HSG11]